MTSLLILRQSFRAAPLLCFLLSGLLSQTYLHSQSGTQALITRKVPASISQCEGDQCTRGGGGALWLFEGALGQAMWHYNAVADLKVERYDGRTIVLTRADPPGTYSSRWAGPDGYFRARYLGTIIGSRVEGSVYFNGDTTHPGTWSGTLSESPCIGDVGCPLSMEQVRQLGTRLSNRRLFRAAALCSKIVTAPSLAVASPSETAGPVDSNGICQSSRIRETMQAVEDLQANDPVGTLLGMAACSITGVCGDTEHPGSIHATILRSRSVSDGGGYTAKDPGTFLCQGLFARGDVHLKVGKDGDLSSELTKDEMSELLKQLPNFVENFKVRPLGNGRFMLILIPSLTGISKDYSAAFTYP